LAIHAPENRVIGSPNERTSCGNRHILWSGGNIKADVIVVGSGGDVHADSGIHAELVVVNDDEVCLEGVEAKTLIDGRTMILEPSKGMAKLREMLVPECFADDGPDDDAVFDAKPLFERIRKGERWSRASSRTSDR
jgi:hypothetical protein